MPLLALIFVLLCGTFAVFIWYWLDDRMSKAEEYANEHHPDDSTFKRTVRNTVNVVGGVDDSDSVICAKCNHIIDTGSRPNFCPFCGKALNYN